MEVTKDKYKNRLALPLPARTVACRAKPSNQPIFRGMPHHWVEVNATEQADQTGKSRDLGGYGGPRRHAPLAQERAEHW